MIGTVAKERRKAQMKIVNVDGFVKSQNLEISGP
jgi:hypothetical protein